MRTNEATHPCGVRKSLSTNLEQAQKRRTSKKMELTSSSSTEGAAATPGSSGHMTVINDEWQTALESWKQIAPLFKSYENKHIWMPFYYDGECAKSENEH